MSESPFEERAESFVGELMREQYLVRAGLKPELELVPIYQRYADLIAESTVREIVSAWQKAGNGIRDPALEDGVKQAQHLAGFAVSAFLENAAKELTESITNAELKATILWDDKPIPYQSVRTLMTRESDYRRRHELLKRQLAVTKLSNPDRAKRLKTLHEVARSLGFVGYRGMVEQLRGWDLNELSSDLEPLLQATEDIFEDKLAEQLSAARVPRARADTSDIVFVMRAPDFDALFPGDQMMRVLQRTLTGMGLELESTPGLRLDTEPRPLKSSRAFCAPVRVPSEVYLVIKPIGGQDDYRALFHESGHAEHFSHVQEELPFAFRYLGEEAISETFAFLFEHIVSSPRWLVDVLRAPLREAERYQRFALFSKLWMLRRYTAKLRYELVLHDQGPDGVEDAYRDILSELLHVPVPPERFLDDVDDGLYVAGYLRAWIFERQLADFLERRFGEGWYEARDAGGFLRRMWELGLRDSVEELARTRVGANGIDVHPLIKELSDF